MFCVCWKRLANQYDKWLSTPDCKLLTEINYIHEIIYWLRSDQ